MVEITSGARFNIYSDKPEPMLKNGAVGSDDTPGLPKGLNGPTGPMMRQTPVTLNMLNHADSVAAGYGMSLDGEVYAVELVSERNRYLEAVVANMPTVQSVKEMLDGKDAEITTLRRALAAKDARIAELKSVLASTPVAFEDLDAKPAVVPNPFREFPRDMRRMGP
jgi:hypothetical protein